MAPKPKPNAAKVTPAKGDGQRTLPSVKQGAADKKCESATVANKSAPTSSPAVANLPNQKAGANRKAGAAPAAASNNKLPVIKGGQQTAQKSNLLGKTDGTNKAPLKPTPPNASKSTAKANSVPNSQNSQVVTPMDLGTVTSATGGENASGDAGDAVAEGNVKESDSSAVNPGAVTNCEPGNDAQPTADATANGESVEATAAVEGAVPTTDATADATADATTDAPMEVPPEEIKNNGTVTLIYERYDEKFPIVNGTTTQANIDEEYCLSYVMPDCLIHLSVYEPAIKHAREADGLYDDLYLKEDPRGTYHGLMDDNTYYVYAEQEAEQLARDQAHMRQIAAGMEGAVQRDENGEIMKPDDGRAMESCSCIYGNPCVDEYGCKDWDNRYAVAKKNGWKGF